jgi:hypothetical protein
MIAGSSFKRNTKLEGRSLPFNFSTSRSQSDSLIKFIEVLSADQDAMLQLELSGRLGRVQYFDRLHRLKSWGLSPIYAVLLVDLSYP